MAERSAFGRWCPVGELQVVRPEMPPVKANAVDRLVGFFSPEKMARRIRARAAVSFWGGMYGGGYNAGRYDRKALQEYHPYPGSADTDVNPGLTAIRARSRDLARNAPLAGGAINTTVTSTVGSGIAAQPRIDRQLLGISDKDADAWERRARTIWEAWAETTECDLEGELDFYGLQSLAFRSVLESGDLLSVFRWRPRPGSLFGTRLQVVEADRISNPHFELDTPRRAQGVELDGDGQVLGYWVQQGHPGDVLLYPERQEWTRLPARGGGGRRIAWLLYDKRRPGQRRGVPYLASVVEPMKQLERYTETELTAAVVSAMFTVFVKSESDAAVSGIVGEDAPVIPGDIHLGPGVIAELQPGEDIEFANPSRPNAGFDPFVMSILRQVGVSLELPFEILIKHFQSSYSASRGAILEAWKFFRGRREWLGSYFGDHAYEAVISEAVAKGWLEAPGFFEDPFLRRAWLRHTWSGDAMPQLDPLKEVNAAARRVEEGFSTREREAMELTGTSWEENHRQGVKEEGARREAGLSSSSAVPLQEFPDPEEAAA
jgi:lambda family phage portal protein